MKTITPTELKRLAQSTVGPHVSIYTHAEVSRRAWEMRVRAILYEAKRAVRADALDFGALEEQLLAVRPGGYVCGLLSTETARVIELPEHVQDLVLAGSRFHLAPLMRFVRRSEAWALCIGLGHNSLYRGDLFQSARLDSPALPQHVDEVRPDDGAEPSLHYHSTNFSVFHGQGVGVVARTKDAVRLFRAVDDRVAELLPLSSQPRVLIGLAQWTSLYDQISKLQWTIAPSVDPSSLSDEARWDIAIAAARDHLLGEPEAKLSENRPVVVDIPKALQAACEGRVETLFIERGARMFALVRDGNLIPSMQRTSDRELVDRTAACALLHGSEVHVLPRSKMPTKQPVAAVLRY